MGTGVLVEWPLGLAILELTARIRRGTLLGGQFDWGGRSNGGEGSLSERKSKECNRRSERDAAESWS